MLCDFIAKTKVLSFDLSDKYFIVDTFLIGDKYLVCDAKVVSIDFSDKYLIGLSQSIFQTNTLFAI